MDPIYPPNLGGIYKIFPGKFCVLSLWENFRVSLQYWTQFLGQAKKISGQASGIGPNHGPKNGGLPKYVPGKSLTLSKEIGAKCGHNVPRYPPMSDHILDPLKKCCRVSLLRWTHFRMRHFCPGGRGSGQNFQPTGRGSGQHFRPTGQIPGKISTLPTTFPGNISGTPARFRSTLHATFVTYRMGACYVLYTIVGARLVT